jgi:hypothetical protein
MLGNPEDDDPSTRRGHRLHGPSSVPEGHLKRLHRQRDRLGQPEPHEIRRSPDKHPDVSGTPAAPDYSLTEKSAASPKNIDRDQQPDSAGTATPTPQNRHDMGELARSQAELRLESRKIINESLKSLARDIGRFRRNVTWRPAQCAIVEETGMVPTISCGSYLVIDETKYLDYTTGFAYSRESLTPGHYWKFQTGSPLCRSGRSGARRARAAAEAGQTGA